MPRQTSKRLKGQKKVFEQDSFDFTAPRHRGAARPVDAFARPTQDNSSANIMKFVGSLNRGGQGLANMVREKQRVDGERGTTSAMRGEGSDPDESAAFLNGHEKFQGQAAANKYRLEMDNLYKTKYQSDPTEWNAAVNKINSKFLNGASDSYVQGFVPAASQIEAQYEKKYADQQFIMIQDDYLANVGEGTELAMSMVLKDDSIPAGEKAAAIRSKVTDMQEMGKHYGLDRTAVSKVAVTKIGVLAQQTGRPDLMNFALVRDKDGHRMIDRPEMADMVTKYIKGSMREQQSQVDVKIAQDVKKQKEIDISIDRALVVSTESGDFKDAKNLLEEHADSLTPERLAYHIKRITALETDEGWTTASSPEDFRTYYNLATEGKMDPHDWEAARYQLTKAEYKEIGKIDIKSREAGAKHTTSNAMVGDYKRALLKKVNPLNMYGLTTLGDPGLGAERAEFVNNRFHEWKYNKQEAGEEIAPEDLWKISKLIEADALETFPEPFNLTASKPAKPAGQHTQKKPTGDKPTEKKDTGESAGAPVLSSLEEMIKRIETDKKAKL